VIFIDSFLLACPATSFSYLSTFFEEIGGRTGMLDVDLKLSLFGFIPIKAFFSFVVLSMLGSIVLKYSRGEIVFSSID